MGGGRKGSARRLILDHCTVAGAGLLQLSGFSPQLPLQVEVKGCAVQTQALVCWTPVTTDTPLNHHTLQWRGEGNLLDVSGRSWIVQSDKSTTGPATGITNLDGWSQLARESEPVAGGAQFVSPPETRLESLTPEDFALMPAAGRKVGADPNQVGPGSIQPKSSS